MPRNHEILNQVIRRFARRLANEAGLEAKYIGRIEIYDDHSLVDLPEGMPKELYRELQKVWVAGQQLRLSRVESGAPTVSRSERPARKPRKP